MRHQIGFFSGLLLFFLILILPAPQDLPREGLLVAATAVLMAVWWISEALPIAAVSLLPVVLFPLMDIMPTGEVTAQYGHHIIYLFMGGFFIAVTMERWNLHRRIALHIILFVGQSPNRIILGFMIASAFLSMWVSNTATVLMMVPIGLAVIDQTRDLIKKSGDSPTGPEAAGSFNFAIALMLGIAYACSIGGVGTLIGTPPNAVFAGVAETMFGQQISFAGWMFFALPLVVIMLFLTWAFLVYIAYPPGLSGLAGESGFIESELTALGPITHQERRVLGIFVFVAASWIGTGLVEISWLNEFNDTGIAILGSLLLFATPAGKWRDRTFLLDWPTARSIPWGILVLFGGGLALAHGFTISGLATWIAERMMILDGRHLFLVLLAVTGMTVMLTEVTSNTATSTMLMPILASMAAAMAIHPYGLMVAAAIAASFAFMLPVATPPNAVVFGSSFITIPHMARAGIWVNLIGLILIALFTYFLLPLMWDLELITPPHWTN